VLSESLIPRGYPLAHPPSWRDPASEVWIPKGKVDNLKWRLKLLTAAAEDLEYQQALQALCAKSPLFWVNAFAWTFRVLEVIDGHQRPVKPENAHVPFITWPVQDPAILKLVHNIEHGGSLCIDKSRDMGASWIILAVLTWFWLYRPDSKFLLVSRKEDLVDKPGDSDSLFWKIDRMVKSLPAWMQPATTRTSMHLANEDNGAVIDGESTNENIGRGGRRTAIVFDEAAAIPMLQAAISAAGPATSCVIYNSTPLGPGAYCDVRFSGIDVIVLGYWDHPEKGQGREIRFDPRVGRNVWWTTWYEAEWTVEKRSRKYMAQNALIDHMTSGTMVFDSDVLTHQLAMVRPPTWRGRIEMDVDRVGDLDTALRNGRIQDIQLVEDRDGPLCLWCELIEDPRTGLLRPRQDRTPVMGGDVALGVGASNSVLSLGWADTKTKFGEWVDANTSPDDLARVAVMLGYWLGGRHKRALISWEANGPGGIFTSRIKRIGYPWLDKHKDTAKPSAKVRNEYGFTTTTHSKAVILGELNGDMGSGTFLNPSERALREAGRYVYYATGGGLGPAQLEQESADAHATHGDIVMADAILNRAMKLAGRVKPQVTEYPYGSRGWREKQAEEEESEAVPED